MEDQGLPINIYHNPKIREKFSRKTSIEALATFGLKAASHCTPELAWKEPEEDKPEKWSSVCLHFTQNTTFHGINKITESTPFTIRRVIWVLILLGGVSLFIIQMMGSVLHYLEYPVTVSTRIIYNKTVTFPAVTVCNQNVFRISQAALHGHYSLIDKIYRHDSLQNLNLSEQEIKATDTTLKFLYDNTAHNKQDMIVRCTWDRQSCNTDDFVTTITDHGVCFTFNSGKTGPVKMASQTGSDRGLRLKLNIEQYEYMRGPNRAAGAKILVHDQAEVPFVRDFGQSISPGSHAFVGVQLTQINNLRKPHGECSADVNLKYFTDYNIPNCQVDCMANYLRKRCNCRLVHMPDLPNYPGKPVYCTFGQMQKCIEPELESFDLEQKTDSSAEKCNCSVPCTHHRYDTTISYASTSKFDMEHQDREDNKAIQRRLVNALEITQRVDPAIIMSDQKMVGDLEEVAASIGQIFEQIANKMHNITVFLDDVYFELTNRTYFHREYGLTVVQRALQYGFMQFWDINQQQVLTPLSAGTKQMLNRFGKAMPLLANASGSPDAFRHMVAWYKTELLTSKLVMAYRMNNFLRRVHESILSGTPLLKYQWAFNSRYDQVTVPKPLLRSDVSRSTNLNNYLVDKVNNTIHILKRFRHMAGKAFNNQKWNDTYFIELRTAYGTGILQLSYGYNTFKYEIFGMMERKITKKISSFSKLEATMGQERSNLDITIQNFNSLIAKVNVDVWPAIKDIVNLSRQYRDDVTMNKTTLARLVASAEIDSHLQQMADVFIDLRARARNLEHDWRKFQDAQIEVWKAIKGEDTTREFYEKLYQDFQSIFSAPDSNYSRELLGPFHEMFDPLTHPLTLFQWTNADMAKQDKDIYVTDTKLKFETFIDELDILSGISKKENFFQIFRTWRQSLKNFIADSSMDDSFFKENFLEVDVYMTELYYQIVEQQEAYDLTNLWSDIGGSMGLFVGASVITVFELIDAILHNLLKIQLHKKKERPPSLVIVDLLNQKEAQLED